jgi:polysaccharide deacetylase family protein (PEP-CTERM system associated)
VKYEGFRSSCPGRGTEFGVRARRRAGRRGRRAWAVQNAVTVDVEDYFQVSAFRRLVRYDDWGRMESRIERNTAKALDLLSQFDLCGTFFVLGWVAERFPRLVRAICARGHELGCHSYAHRLVYEMTPQEFRDDTQRAQRAIENAAGVLVQVYRAPSFSITSRSSWALEILLELGFTADSSIFPLRLGPLDRRFLYGWPDAPRQPFRLRVSSGELREFPLPTFRFGPWTLPATGGAYLRLWPYAFQCRRLGQFEEQGSPWVLYFHPWELDAQQPRMAASIGARAGHYARLAQTEQLLRRLFRRFRFGKLSDLAVKESRTWSASGTSP